MKILELLIKPLADGHDFIHNKGVIAWRILSSLRGSQEEVKFEHLSGDWKYEQLQSDFRPTNNFFNDIQSARVTENKSLLEFVWFEDESMWQFVPTEIWADTFRAIETIRVLMTLIEDRAPESIIAHHVSDWSAPLWAGCVRSVAETRGLPLKMIGAEPTGDWRDGLIARTLLRPIWRKVRQLGGRQVEASQMPFAVDHDFAKRVRQRVESAGQKPSQSEPLKLKTLLFLGNRAHWQVRPDEPGRFHDNQLYPLLPSLRERGWSRFLALDCFYYDEALMQSRRKSTETGVSWRGLFEYPPQRFNQAQVAETFLQQFKRLRSSGSFARAFQFQGTSLWPALEHRVRMAFQVRLTEAIYLRRLVRHILLREAPTAILATGETSPVPRAFLVESRRAGIPSLGLQHGNMFGNHYNYMHKQVRPALADPHPGFVVPTRFCVWGQLWWDNLVKLGHWPKESVVVTGLWQLDALSGRNRALVRKQIRDVVGAKTNQKVILIVASKLDVVDFLRRTLSVLDDEKDSIPVIRIHPQDDRKPVLDMLKQYGYPEHILSNENTHALLAASDIVVSQLTTVISEALFFDRPTIVVDYQGMEGWSFYKNSAACLHAHSENILRNALEDLRKPEVENDLRIQRRAFVEDLFHRDDGKSSSRVVDVLEMVLDKHRFVNAQRPDAANYN